MGISLGEDFPNFTADTTVGKINFHEWIGNSWTIMFSHPSDYTPVCTTELARLTELQSQFEKRKVKLIALSCDNVQSHKDWSKDVEAITKSEECHILFPIISDPKRELAVKLKMLDPKEKDSEGQPLTCRAVFVIGPDKKLQLSILYPATTGRNFDEILRVVDSLQLTASNLVATPVNWKPGDDVIVAPHIKDADLPKLFPKGVKHYTLPSGKNYMRTTKM